MIVSIQSALEFLKVEMPEADLKRKIKSIESLIRDETSNNFQRADMRIYAPSRNNVIEGSSLYFEVGDTIEINESINQGIYTIV